MKENPYSILGVTPDMSEKEIKTVYRKLAKLYHPDVSGGSQEKFMRIQNAWEELKKHGSKSFNQKMSRVTHKTLFKFRRI